MTREALLAEILSLSLEERIRLIGDAWDSIAVTPDDVPVPQWHVAELDRRMAESGPEYLSWDEVRRRLRDGG